MSGTEHRECFQRYDWCPGPDVPDEDGEAFGGKCQPCFIDRRPDVDRTLSQPIMDVWGGYDDFDSWDYVAFVIKKNAEELEDTSNFGEAKGELADMAICALRMLAEMGYNPEAAVLERLDGRMDGEQNEIISSYKRRFENRSVDTGTDQ